MLNRRSFVMAATGGAAWGQTAPSGHINLGVIGSGSRGTFVMTVFQKNPAARVAAICDIYEPNLEKALSLAHGAKPYRNYKALLDDKNVHAVLITTPEHWHTQMLLDAMAAGKDVYIEKPLCQTPEQGVALMNAGRQSKSVVQVGMQRRSYDLYREARGVVSSNRLGNVRMIRAWWLNNYLHDSTKGKLAGPLDWDQWLGPAPRRALDPVRFFHWRMFSDYGGGIVADQGAHVFDGIHMLMSAQFPLWVNASAGRKHQPAFDTPESVTVAAEYPQDFLAVFTINYAAMRYKTRNDQLNQYDGDRARFDIGREEYTVYDQGGEETPALHQVSAGGFGKATDEHVNNFLDCVRTRQTPNAPIPVGFEACLIAQLANMSLERGRRIGWNAAAMKVEV
ncbi:MAG: Gfo/Idh/MocA family oxidoreductase [Bryobacteraceae bacterium]